MYGTRTSDINSISSDAERGSDLNGRKQSRSSPWRIYHRAEGVWCLTVCNWRAWRKGGGVRILNCRHQGTQLSGRRETWAGFDRHFNQHNQTITTPISGIKHYCDGIQVTARTQSGKAELKVTALRTWTLWFFCLFVFFLFFVSLILWMSEKGRHRMKLGSPWDWERREWGKQVWNGAIEMKVYVIQEDEYEEHSVKYVHAFTRSDGTRYSK